MATLFAIISFFLTVFFIKKFKNEDSFINFSLSFASVTVFVFSTVFMVEAIYILGTAHTIDEKISMYEQENEALEQSVASTVMAYMEYEKETYGNLSNKDAMDLVTVYPELKADELITQQISLYRDNNRMIKELRAKKINLANARWLLYFGK